MRTDEVVVEIELCDVGVLRNPEPDHAELLGGHPHVVHDQNSDFIGLEELLHLLRNLELVFPCTGVNPTQIHLCHILRVQHHHLQEHVDQSRVHSRVGDIQDLKVSQ